MKTCKALLAIILLVPFFITAQTKEGYIQFSIDVKAIDTSMNARRSASLMRDSKMEIYYAKDKSRVDFTFGKISNTSVRIDRTTNKGISITKSVYGNFANQNTAESFLEKKVKADTATIKITPFNEYKTILGFKCRKYVMEDNGSYSTYWITKEIKVEDLDQQLVNPNLPGFPLEFVTISKGIRMEFEASNFKSSLENKSEIFSTEPPEGYKVVEH